MNIDEFIKNNSALKVKGYMVRDKECVIYFICTKIKKDIIYIGTTINIHDRVKSHSNKIEFKDCIVYYFKYPCRKCLKKERELIEALRPQYNNMFLGPRRKDEKYYSYRKKGDYTPKVKQKLIKELLKKAKMTQTDLAKKTNSTRQYISQILTNGGGSNRIIKDIAIALDVDWHDIILPR